MATRHNDGAECALCEEKLATAHEYLGQWFRGVKKDHPSLHVCWAYRDQLDQDNAFAAGKSRLKYPFSPHNNKNDGRPYSLALDLFFIENGKAFFPTPVNPHPVYGDFYLELNKRNVASGEPVLWGGTFKSFSDRDHYQYNEVSRQDIA